MHAQHQSTWPWAVGVHLLEQGLAFDPAPPLPGLLSPPACALVAVIVCPAASAPTVAIRALYKAAHFYTNNKNYFNFLRRGVTVPN